MLRILFTGTDLARTRIAAAHDSLWELALGIQMLRPQRGDALFGSWRRKARTALREARLGPMGSLLVALNPNVGYFPDFLTPGAAAGGIEEGLAAVRATPRRALSHDLARLAAARTLPAEARQLGAGEPGLLERLTAAMRTVYRIIVSPYERGIEMALAQDRHKRINAMTQHGVEGLLTSFSPAMRWTHGELAIPSHRDQELHLDGRGIQLIPSYFCVSGPLTLFDPDRPPVLVYPVARPPVTLPGFGQGQGQGQAAPALGALVGTTRSAILDSLYDRDATTTDLARRVGVSPAAASEHTKILRQAGLVISSRDRNRMLHTLSEMGRTLLTHHR